MQLDSQIQLTPGALVSADRHNVERLILAKAGQSDLNNGAKVNNWRRFFVELVPVVLSLAMLVVLCGLVRGASFCMGNPVDVFIAAAIICLALEPIFCRPARK